MAGRKPINAKAETVATLPSFCDAYKWRRCLVPINNFFEWKTIKGVKPKQPHAVGMKGGEPFALAGRTGRAQKQVNEYAPSQSLPRLRTNSSARFMTACPWSFRRNPTIDGSARSIPSHPCLGLRAMVAPNFKAQRRTVSWIR
jgi:hypothetical protein